jgi:hypothetical protein
MPQVESLEERQLALDERKQKLEESWPKKWGTVLIGAIASVAATVISGMFAYVQHDADSRRQQAQQTQDYEDRLAKDKLAQINADNDLKLKNLENDRQAAVLYFQYIAPRPVNEVGLQDKIGLVEAIASNNKLLEPFRNAKVVAAVQGGGAPSDALVGSPNVVAPQKTSSFSGFVSYIQYAKGDDQAGAAARALIDDVRTLGFTAPGLQGVKVVPNYNEIRIYKPEHAPLAQKLAGQLNTAGRGGYCIRQIGNSQSLPNGVVELWIGKAPAPKPGAKCSDQPKAAA